MKEIVKFIQGDQKSLCTWRLQYNHQVHKDVLITFYILS